MWDLSIPQGASNPSLHLGGGCVLPNQKARITQSEISRALKAARAAGFFVAKFEILDDGGLRVFLGEEQIDDATNEWDLGLRIV